MPVTFEEARTLPDWLFQELPFKRRVAVIDGLRIHFVDEGAGPVVMMQHGNPTWCFLWRKVIRDLLPHGIRVIAPDLMGLGLSDKPRALKAHSLDQHVMNTTRLVEALDLRDFTVVGQDWGGPIIAGMAACMPDRVRAAVFANTAVFPPRVGGRATWFHRFAHRPIVSDIAFRGFGFPVPTLHQVQGDPGSIGPLEKRAYAWPLRGWKNRAAPLALARMVPIGEGHPSIPLLESAERWARNFRGPVALVWGMRDPVLGRSLKRMREIFPDAPVTETQAGHFLQEEVPEILAEAILQVTLGRVTPA